MEGVSFVFVAVSVALMSFITYHLNDIYVRLNEEDEVDIKTGGFRILADPSKGLITPTSLRKNCLLLGVEEISEGDAEAMVQEGDLDGDGALNATEFCILMLRFSSEMMEDA